MHKLSIIISAVFLCSCAEQSAENQFSQDLVRQNTALQQQVNQLKFQLDSLQNQSTTQAFTNGSTLLSETDVSYLKKRGMQNPVSEIKLDLLQNNGLMPAEGTLGGTMRFYEERIYVLNRKWVLAYFEDGHMAGQMLLEYKVGTDGKLSWKVLISSII